jgi:hypothetical protein
MTDLATIRQRAREHQDDLDLALVYLTPQDLTKRWQVSITTVKAIPRDELPYKEIGRGVHLKRRRYNPLDVEAFESRDRGGLARERSA